MSEPSSSSPPSPARGISPAWEDPSFQPAVNDPAPDLTLVPGGLTTPSLNAACTRIGSAVGSAQRQLRHGLQLVRQGASATPSAELLQEIEEQAEELRRNASEGVGQLCSQAAATFQQLRTRARALAEEYPLHTIAVAAGSCFALGFALRLRRHHG